MAEAFGMACHALVTARVCRPQPALMSRFFGLAARLACPARDAKTSFCAAAALRPGGAREELLSKVGDAGFRRRVRLAFLRP
jgi:hypothetical protein